MIATTKTDEGYSFERIDEDGEAWDLGHANLGEDEIYDGYFDTKRITFEDLDQCIDLIMKRKPGERITYRGVVDMKTSKDELIGKAAEITNMQWDVYKSYESCIGPSDAHETTFRMMMKWGAYVECFSELFGLDSLDFLDVCREVRHEAENDCR